MVSTRKSKVEKASKDSFKSSYVFTERNLVVSPSETSLKNDQFVISDYEKARLDNIRKNEEFLSKLGVPSLKNAIISDDSSKNKNNIKKNTISKLGLKVPTLPSRRSERVTADKLLNEIKSLKENGKDAEALIKQSELEAMVAKKNEGVYQIENKTSDADTFSRLLLPISIKDFINNEDDLNKEQLKKEFIDSWRPVNRLSNEDSRDLSMGNSLDPLKSLSLTDDCIAKLTPGRITAVAIHPSDSNILAFAGDKNGFIGIWDVNYRAKGIQNGGIYRYRPHISNIMKIHIDEDRPTELTSLSYDGTVKILDLNQECFRLGFEAIERLEDLYFSDACYSPFFKESLLVGKSSGEASLIDFRVSNKVYQWNYQLQENKLNSVQFHPTNSNLIISAGSRSGAITIHDIRKAGKYWKPILNLTQHSKTTNAAYVSPDGNYLVSVSLDDTIRTWKNFDGSPKDTICNVLKHNNFTGRWLSTFRPTFDPKRPRTFVMGSMLQPRRIEIFTVQEIQPNSFTVDLTTNLISESLVSVNSRNCFHPKLEMILGSNSSGKVHLFK